MRAATVDMPGNALAELRPAERLFHRRPQLIRVDELAQRAAQQIPRLIAHETGPTGRYEDQKPFRVHRADQVVGSVKQPVALASGLRARILEAQRPACHPHANDS